MDINRYIHILDINGYNMDKDIKGIIYGYNKWV